MLDCWAKQSFLEPLILFGEKSLRADVHNFVAHCHRERNRQGWANRIINSEAGNPGNTRVVQRHQRPGSMLNYYYRAA